MYFLLMRISASDHAIYRLMERGIDVEVAKSVIRRPENTKNVSDGRIISSRTMKDGRKLSIIHVNDKIGKKVEVTVITGYYEE